MAVRTDLSVAFGTVTVTVVSEPSQAGEVVEAPSEQELCVPAGGVPKLLAVSDEA